MYAGPAAMTLDIWAGVEAIRAVNGLHCNLSWDSSAAKKIVPASLGCYAGQKELRRRERRRPRITQALNGAARRQAVTNTPEDKQQAF